MVGVTKGVKSNKRDLDVCWHDLVHWWLGSATYVSSLMRECTSDQNPTVDRSWMCIAMAVVGSVFYSDIDPESQHESSSVHVLIRALLKTAAPILSVAQDEPWDYISNPSHRFIIHVLTPIWQHVSVKLDKYDWVFVNWGNRWTNCNPMWSLDHSIASLFHH